uniref:DNA-directed DNA polymerase n=1 Tax=Schizaphis graminum TaxID=13262 RepID=A0A2S2PQR8_SCHGA
MHTILVVLSLTWNILFMFKYCNSTTTNHNQTRNSNFFKPAENIYDYNALDQHTLICGSHKPILPQMPEPGSMLEFSAWNKTQRHPIVIYADFEAHLPKKANLYSTLTEEHICDSEYEHAIAVWNYFKCKNLGEYSDLYLKIDIMLLADVFENFRDLCLATYVLDPVFCTTLVQAFLLMQC